MPNNIHIIEEFTGRKLRANLRDHIQEIFAVIYTRYDFAMLTRSPFPEKFEILIALTDLHEANGSPRIHLMPTLQAGQAVILRGRDDQYFLPCQGGNLAAVILLDTRQA